MRFTTFASALVLMFSAASAIEIEGVVKNIAAEIDAEGANNGPLYLGRPYISRTPTGRGGAKEPGNLGYVRETVGRFNH